MILFLAPYYWHQVCIKAMEDCPHGTAGEIMAKLLHIPKFFLSLEFPWGAVGYKDLVSSLQWLRLLLWYRFDPGPRDFHMPQVKTKIFCFGFFVLFCFVLLFRAMSIAYGGSQASGQIRVTAASLYHSHSNSNLGSKLHL